MTNRRNLSLILMVWAVAAAPVFAGTLATPVGRQGEGLGAQTLHQQIASPESGYFSPQAQFNGAGGTVTNPVGGVWRQWLHVSVGADPVEPPRGHGIWFGRTVRITDSC